MIANVPFGLHAFFGFVSFAQDSVIGACCAVGDFGQRRAQVILGIIQYAANQGTAMSASVAKLWANFWNGDASSVVNRKDIDDITVTSVTKNDNTTTSMTENASSSGGGSSDGGGGGGKALQGVFLSSKRNRLSKRAAYNRADRSMKEKAQQYRLADTWSKATAARAKILASAKPTLPATSLVASASRNDGGVTGSTWQTLDALRTGPSTCQPSVKKKASPEKGA